MICLRKVVQRNEAKIGFSGPTVYTVTVDLHGSCRTQPLHLSVRIRLAPLFRLPSFDGSAVDAGLPVTFSGWGGGGAALNEMNWGREKKQDCASAPQFAVSPFGKMIPPFQFIVVSSILFFLYAGLSKITAGAVDAALFTVPCTAAPVTVTGLPVLRKRTTVLLASELNVKVGHVDILCEK